MKKENIMGSDIIISEGYYYHLHFHSFEDFIDFSTFKVILEKLRNNDKLVTMKIIEFKNDHEKEVIYLVGRRHDSKDIMIIPGPSMNSLGYCRQKSSSKTILNKKEQRAWRLIHNSLSQILLEELEILEEKIKPHFNKYVCAFYL